MAENEHVLIAVAGRSGSGKDSLVDLICKRTNASKLISYTTRPRRNGEKDTHVFVTEDDYNEMLNAGQIAAYTKIGDYRYWSTIDQIMQTNFYIIDPFGIETLKTMNIPNLRIVTIYIKTDDKIREERALNLRGDDKTVYRARCFAENEQFRKFTRDEAYDYCISNNGDLAKAYTILRYIAIIEGAMQLGGDIE